MATSRSGAEPDGGHVVRLVTIRDREAEEERAYVDSAVDESVKILEGALALAREREPGQRVVGVVVALAFEDGGYGSLIPLAADRVGHLIGAVADAQHRLLTDTNNEE